MSEVVGLDDVDARLVSLLRRDARLTMAELGRRVGLSRTATLARVRRLEDEGVIRGYRADVAAPQVRPHVARVAVVLKTHDVAAYVRRLLTIAEVDEAETVAGEYDLLLHIAAPTSARLDAILDRINAWPETVRTTTFVVLQHYT